MNETLSLKNFLTTAFEKRQQRNAAYSLRAFARDLDLAPANLSRALNGLRGLSDPSLDKISKNLHLSAEEKNLLKALNDKQFSKSKEKIAQAKNNLKKLLLYKNSLNDDKFAVISHWYHFGILALMDRNDFQSDHLWIAKQLSLHPKVVNQAIDRLILVGALKKEKNQLISTGNLFIDPKGIPSSSAKEFHHQILKMADMAVDFQGLDTREFNSIVFCFDKSKMQEAKARIRKFREDFELEFGPSDSAEDQDVYALAVQLFQLSSQESK